MSSRSRTATSPLRDLALHIGKSSLTVADECMRSRYEYCRDVRSAEAAVNVVRGLARLREDDR